MSWETMENVLSSISKRRALSIMEVLSDGASSYNVIAKSLNIENQQLNRALRPLIRSKLVHRRVQESPTPVRVYYSLTPNGVLFLGAMETLRKELVRQHARKNPVASERVALPKRPLPTAFLRPRITD